MNEFTAVRISPVVCFRQPIGSVRTLVARIPDRLLRTSAFRLAASHALLNRVQIRIETEQKRSKSGAKAGQKRGGIVG